MFTRDSVILTHLLFLLYHLGCHFILPQELQPQGDQQPALVHLVRRDCVRR